MEEEVFAESDDCVKEGIRYASVELEPKQDGETNLKVLVWF